MTQPGRGIRWGAALAVLTLSACGGGEKGAAAAGDAAAPGRAAAVGGEGYTLTFTSTTTVERGRAPRTATGTVAPVEVTGTVKLQSGKARLDFNQLPTTAAGAPEAIQQGGYMLLEAGTGRMTMVNPVKKEALQMTGDMMSGMSGPMMPKFDVTDVTSKTEELGAGETILGFATRKYRVTNGYTLSVSMMGQNQTMRNEQVTEVQSSEEISAFDPAFTAFQETFQNSFGGMLKDVLQKLKAANPSALMQKGFVLAQTSRNTVIANGDTTVSNATLRVTQFKRGAIPAEDFVLPSDIKVQDLQAMMAEQMRKSGGAAAGAGAKP